MPPNPPPTRNTMDFFGAQDAARKRTGMLVFYLILCVLTISIATYAAVWACWMWTSTETSIAAPDLFIPRLFLWSVGGTLLIISCGAGFKMLQLSSGGAAVAQMFGGRLVQPNTRDADERRLMNIVEEMAIASGIHVPPVYVIDDERAINAFAAGHTPNTAVVAVTAGTLRMLNRDELQGVVGHEFSHILNGDMRMNLRLMGILFGILCLYTIGEILLRSGATRHRRSYASNKKGGNPLPIFGLLLMLIGGIGLFFGRLIQAAISRQREYLADASAVQFTRNPAGIAGALKKIGGYSRHAKLDSAAAGEASHMMFADGVESWFLGALATHPPLEDRIRRIDPAFDGRFSKVDYPPEFVEADTNEARRDVAVAMALSDAAGPAAAMAFARGGRRARLPDPPERPAQRERDSRTANPPASGTLDPEQVLQQIGQVTPEQMDYAERLLFKIPDALLDLAHEPLGANAIMYALLLSDNETVRAKQVAHLRQHAHPAVNQEVGVVVRHLSGLPEDIRLKLLDLSLPALKQLAPRQYDELKGCVQQLIDADGQISLFEFMLIKLMRQSLDAHFSGARPPVVQFYALNQLGPECEILLSQVACSGAFGTLPAKGSPDAASAENLTAAQKAFQTGVAMLQVRNLPFRLVPPEKLYWPGLDRALNRLRLLTPPLKRRVLAACAAAIGMDGRVRTEEAELFRAVAAAIDCPVPPLFSTPEPAAA